MHSSLSKLWEEEEEEEEVEVEEEEERERGDQSLTGQWWVVGRQEENKVEKANNSSHVYCKSDELM